MFDEATRIGGSLEALQASGLLDERLELVLVDDGSRDGTPEVVEAAGRRARPGPGAGRAAAREPGQGRGGAGRDAGRQRRRRVFVDADLCVGADDIERCFATLESGEAEVVYGTRAHAHSAMDQSQPGYRVVTGRVFNYLLRSLGLTEELDTQCGLKGVTADAAAVVMEPLVTERFAFDVEVLARAGRARPARRGAAGALVARRGEPRAARAGRRRDGHGRPCASGAGSTRRRPAGRRGGAGPSAGTVMAVDAIDAMAKVERDHWWFRAKHRLVLDELRRQRVAGTVVDVGRRHRRAARAACGRRATWRWGWSWTRWPWPTPGPNQRRLPLCQSFAEAVPVRDGGGRRRHRPRRARAPRRRRARPPGARRGWSGPAGSW